MAATPLRFEFTKVANKAGRHQFGGHIPYCGFVIQQAELPGEEWAG